MRKCRFKVGFKNLEMCACAAFMIYYPSKVQHILQHEADPGGGLSLLYYFLHLIEVLVHTRLRMTTTVW